MCLFAVSIPVINTGTPDAASAWTLIYVQWNTLREKILTVHTVRIPQKRKPILLSHNFILRDFLCAEDV